MTKKSKKSSAASQNASIEEISYHFSWGMRILLFFTFALWIIPFIFTSLFFGKKIRNFLQNIPNPTTNALTSENPFSFYNSDMVSQKADDKLIISPKQWAEMKPQDVVISSGNDVSLATFLFRAKKTTNNWIIVCHGWGQNRFSILYLVLPFYHAGYNVLVYDARNHGASTKTSCTFVVKEAQDLFFVIKYLNEKIDTVQGNKKITLIGNSMGATTILQTLQNFNLTALGVKCAIFDCGYDDFSNIIKVLINHRLKVPWFWSYFGVKFYLLFKDHFNVHDIKPITKMKFCSETPILFIHGLLDKTVPVAMTKRLYEAKIKHELINYNQKFSKLLLLPDAGHVQSVIKYYDLYCETTLEFINFWINKQ